MYHRVRFTATSLHATSGSCQFAYVLTDVLLHEQTPLFVLTALVPHGADAKASVQKEWPSSRIQWVEQNVLTFVGSDWMTSRVFGSYVSSRSVSPGSVRSWFGRLWRGIKYGPVSASKEVS
jgi:hypothetical protein